MLSNKTRNQLHYDWYKPTGRKVFNIASTIEIAEKISFVEIPNSDFIRKDLIETFPHDIFL